MILPDQSVRTEYGVQTTKSGTYYCTEVQSTYVLQTLEDFFHGFQPEFDKRVLIRHRPRKMQS